MKQQLVYSMIFYVFYIASLGVFNFLTRLKAIKAGEMSLKYFRSFSEGLSSDRVVVVGRHYDNQFQLPLLFLIGAGAHLALNHITTLTVIIAWAFIATRFLHSYIHLGSNHVKKRALAFAAGWIFILFLWGQLLFASSEYLS